MYNKQIFKRCFDYRGKYWYRNITNGIPLYFRQLHYLIKNGYDESAHWETYDWFITTMRPILTFYKKYHLGIPILTGTFENTDLEKNKEIWEATIDEMILLLDDMDENNPKYENLDNCKDMYKYMNTAKDRFFQLFSTYFYNLWD